LGLTTPPPMRGGEMEVPVKAAAALYAERVFGLLKLLENS